VVGESKDLRMPVGLENGELLLSARKEPVEGNVIKSLISFPYLGKVESEFLSLSPFVRKFSSPTCGVC